MGLEVRVIGNDSGEKVCNGQAGCAEGGVRTLTSLLHLQALHILRPALYLAKVFNLAEPSALSLTVAQPFNTQSVSIQTPLPAEGSGMLLLQGA